MSSMEIMEMEEGHVKAKRSHYHDVQCFDLDGDTLLRLELNDPGVDGLKIRHPQILIKGAGRAIGNNSILRKIEIIITTDVAGSPRLDEIFLGLSRNRGIESITLMCQIDGYMRFGDYELDNFHILAPFFEHNYNLRCIYISGFDMSHIFNSLASSLAACKNSKLERISLSCNKSTDDQMAMIMKSLQGKYCLRDIRCDEGTNYCAEATCRATAELLDNPSMNIHDLCLEVGANGHNDSCITILGKSLMMNNTVKTLDLGETQVRTAKGWGAISDVLTHPMCTLVALHLNHTKIDNDGITYLSDALVNNKTLNSLSISSNNSITLAGWRHFLKCLETPISALEELDIRDCGIKDEWAILIAQALAKNTSLKILDMSDNELTTTGLVRFCGILLNHDSCCSLVIIDLTGHTLDNEEAITELENIIVRSICDKKSIDGIYSSNHNLCSLSMENALVEAGEIDWPQDIASLFEMNENENKAEVAHEKALRYHFSSGLEGCKANTIFADLLDGLLPFGLEWIGRFDRSGFSLMYAVVHDFPTLVEIRKSNEEPPPAGIKKRKRWYENWW